MNTNNKAQKRSKRRGKISPEVRDYIDAKIMAKIGMNYCKLAEEVRQKYGVTISKASISKRAKALNIQVPRGRKRIFPAEKMPTRSIYLDAAGAFFLKGAELHTGLLATVNQLLSTRIETARARKVLKLAQQINALLLYAPIFGLTNTEDIANYAQNGLIYLTGQKGLPGREEITHYLRFLGEEKLLPLIIKEVAAIGQETLYLSINFAGRTFFLDTQGCTVWPSPKIPGCLSVTINKAESYIKDIFEFPNAQRPLILQLCPGYTFLTPEMFNLIRCFEQAPKEPIASIAIASKSGELFSLWQDVKPRQKCFFIVPLSPWQYAHLQGTKIVRDFQQCYIGPNKEPMACAEAQINLFNPQDHNNIMVRAALVRRKEERLALITNISCREERYIRKIVQQYFCRWPNQRLTNYYDLLEQAHSEDLARLHAPFAITPLFAISYGQKPESVFRLLLEQLHRYTLLHFLPAKYSGEDFHSLRQKLYQQRGYLKIKQDCWEIVLRSCEQNDRQTDLQLACQRFNQSDIILPDQRRLRIILE